MKKLIGLIDYGGKITNLALMKLSTFYKEQGYGVVLNNFTPSMVGKVYCSVVFAKDRQKAMQLKSIYPNIEFGGTGWDIHKDLPPEIESCLPDYDLYRVGDIYPRLGGIGTKASKMRKAQVLVDAGIGFTVRGCVRSCGFCLVPKKEGQLRKVAEIKDLINPKSNVVVLLDNNFTADENILEKLKEIKERNLVIDITQGKKLTEELFIHHTDYGIGKLVSFSPFMGVAVHFSLNNRRFISTSESNLKKMTCKGIPLSSIVDREMRNPLWHVPAGNTRASQGIFSSLPVWPG